MTRTPPRVTYASGRTPRRSGYVTQSLLNRFEGSRKAALEWLELVDRERA